MGTAKTRPASRIPRRLPKDNRTTNRIDSEHGVAHGREGGDHGVHAGGDRHGHGEGVAAQRAAPGIWAAVGPKFSRLTTYEPPDTG